MSISNPSLAPGGVCTCHPVHVVVLIATPDVTNTLTAAVFIPVAMDLRSRYFVRFGAATLVLISFFTMILHDRSIWSMNPAPSHNATDGDRYLDSNHLVNNEQETREDSKEGRVARLSKAYGVDWKWQLDKSPWLTAAEWVTKRQVHPDQPPELGRWGPAPILL